jgi:hypothetical protein
MGAHRREIPYLLLDCLAYRIIFAQRNGSLRDLQAAGSVIFAGTGIFYLVKRERTGVRD